jgi:hypothetical protein
MALLSGIRRAIGEAMKHIFIAIAILFILLLLWCGMSWGATYFIEPDVSNPTTKIMYDTNGWPSDNDGTRTTNTDLEAARIAGGDGAVFILSGGVYGQTYSGTMIDADDGLDILNDNQIWRSPIISDPDYSSHSGTVIVDGTAFTDWTIRINDHNSNTLSNLTIKGDYEFGTIGNIGTSSNTIFEYLTVSGNVTAGSPNIYVAGDVGGDPSNVEISNCVIIIESQPTRGVYFSNADEGSGNSIHDCVIYNTSGTVPESLNNAGIYILRSNSISVYNNTIGDETNRVTEGVLINDSDNNEIYLNTIEWCWDGDTYPDDFGHGIAIQGSSEGNIIRNNYLYKNSRVGILINSSSGNGGNIIKFNLVVASIVNGISHESPANSIPDKIWGNTIYHVPTGSSGHGIAVQINGIKADIRNNLIYAYTIEVSHNIECISITDDANPNEYDVTLNNNLYYAEGTAYIAKDEDGSYSTLSAWQTSISDDSGISEKDVYSLSIDPLLDSNYSPQAGSPAINAGTKWMTPSDGDQYQFIDDTDTTELIYDSDHDRLVNSAIDGIEIGAFGYDIKPDTAIQGAVLTGAVINP